MNWRDQLVSDCSVVVSASERPVGPLKRLMVLVWRQLPDMERRLFLANLDDDLNFVARKKPKQAEKLERDLVEIIRNWSAVLPSLEGDNLRFAQGIAGKCKNNDWWPTEKQAAYMRSLWKDRLIVDGELEVTE